MFEAESKSFASEVAALLTLEGGYAGLTKKAAFRCVRCGAENLVSPLKVRQDIAAGIDPCPACRRRAEAETYRDAILAAVEAFGGEIVGNIPSTKGRLVSLRCGRGHLITLTGKRLLQGDGCPECAYEIRRTRMSRQYVGIRSLIKSTPAFGQEGKGEKR